MAKRTVKDIETSIRARLLNYSKKSGENYNAVLLRFFQERFLARLGISPYKNHFVLKGGLLLLTQHINTFRPTVDIDMLGVAISNEPEQLTTVIQEIAGLELNDGVRFDADTITFTVIKEDAEYEGLRFTFSVHLGKIKSRIQLDIGFGDVVPSGYIKSAFVSMLPDFAAPEILLYPLESIIAEKYQAIVYLGFATSRMKDFYDILFLAKNNTFTLRKLKIAIEATFTQRKTDIERRFFIYEQEYISEKEKQWKAFLKKIGSDNKTDFSKVIEQIKTFLEPILDRAHLKSGFYFWNPDKWIWEKQTYV